jgi:3-dehydroquinate dehydratase type I
MVESPSVFFSLGDLPRRRDNRPKICAVIVSRDFRVPGAILPQIDFFEVRIDLIGAGWQNTVKGLTRPWLATDRSPREGGKGEADEGARVAQLTEAVRLGASMVDVELSLPHLEKVVAQLKPAVVCVISHHDFNGTPSYTALVEIAKRQVAAGADICKVVTTATSCDDNMTVLNLIKRFPENKIVALTMGSQGLMSRILAPLAGGFFTYAALERGKESAPGQLTVTELRDIYKSIGMEG